MALTAVVWANRAQGALASSITNSQTTLTLSSGQGALFPSPATGQFFPLILQSASNATTYEIAYCTLRSSDTLTIIRGQEGTTGQAFNINDLVLLEPTRDTINWGTVSNIAVYRIIGGVQQVSINGSAFTTTGATSFGPTSGPVKVCIWGAGGGSGGCLGTGAMGGSGGGGEYAEGIFAATSTQTVTAGAPGTAGASTPTNGGTGGTTSFGSLMTALGGGGGGAQSGAGSGSAGTGGTGGTGGTFRQPGQTGSIGFAITGAVYAALGGASYGCGMNAPIIGSVAASGAVGVFPGQGSTGPINGSGGGIGGTGMVIVEW